MLNQIVIVGRLVKEPTKEKTEDGKEIAQMTLAVPRSYKNADGIYETDFIDCVLWGAVAENTSEYCKTGDVVGVKGKIQTSIIEDKKGKKNKIMQVIAERVTFLASNKSKEKDKASEEMDM